MRIEKRLSIEATLLRYKHVKVHGKLFFLRDGLVYADSGVEDPMTIDTFTHIYLDRLSN